MMPKRFFKTSVEETPIIIKPDLERKMLAEFTNMESPYKMKHS